MISGADVSNWQGAFKWTGRGYAFGFAKATEGLSYKDARFAANWSAMKSAGLVRGAYHFGHPANSATKEADYFLAAVRAHGLGDDDLLALDLEVSDGKSVAAIAAYARTFCTRIAAKAGRKPVVYVNRNYAGNGSCAGLGAYPLWIADPTTAGQPRLAGPWKAWTLHQYSTTGGIDHDVSRLTAAQLRALGAADPSEDDDVPIRTSLEAVATPLVWNKFVAVKWDENATTPRHGAKGDPGYLPQESTWCDSHASVHVQGMQPGDYWQMRLVVDGWKNGRSSGTAFAEIMADFPATTGDQYCVGSVGKALTKGQHCYLEIACFPAGPTAGRTAPHVVGGRWTLAADKS